MKNHKNIIIQLLFQNMKHEQVMAGLGRLGFNEEGYRLEVADIVAQLMGISDMAISWNWGKLYDTFLGYARKLEIVAEHQNLLPLAEICYLALTDLQAREERQDFPYN